MKRNSTILNEIRRLSFWSLDKLKNTPVKSHFNEVKALMNETRAEVVEEYVHDRVERLLKHARETTGYYREFPSTNSLRSFPVVNKNIIRENAAAFASDTFDDRARITISTSGSTGTPFTVYQDKQKRYRNTADTLFFAQMAHFEIGIRLYYLRVWTDVNSKSGARAWMENVKAIDVTRLSDDYIQAMVETWQKEKRPFAILSYASALESICKYLDKARPKRKIDQAVSIIAMSEGVDEYTKMKVREYFGVPVVSRYSNLENGIIAQQPVSGETSFIINRASYFVEVLQMDKDVPVAHGTPGRIVVTDLFNYAQPMIRYDTGDIGIIENNEEGRLVFSKIEGRKMDMVFDTSGKLISSFTLTNNMLLYPEVRQYQFIQLARAEYKFKLNVEETFKREKELIAAFKSIFGEDAEITVDYVNEIPLLNSGKRKKVMNLM